jgi:hypothetical protein
MPWVPEWLVIVGSIVATVVGLLALGLMLL